MEQNISSRLNGMEYFCCSKQVMGVEHLYYSEQVITSRRFLLFRVGYAKQNISAILSKLYGVELSLLLSSRQEVFCEKGLRPPTLLKNRLCHSCFSVNFVKFLRASFLTEHLWWLPLAIPIRLYQVEHFCYSEQVIPSRRFLLFRVGYIWIKTFILCYFEQVILSRTFLLFQVGYKKNVYTEQKFSAILCSLNQLEQFDDPKKVIQSRNFLPLFFLL